MVVVPWSLEAVELLRMVQRLPHMLAVAPHTARRWCT
jgi:hypothetical protein